MKLQCRQSLRFSILGIVSRSPRVLPKVLGRTGPPSALTVRHLRGASMRYDEDTCLRFCNAGSHSSEGVALNYLHGNKPDTGNPPWYRSLEIYALSRRVFDVWICAFLDGGDCAL